MKVYIPNLKAIEEKSLTGKEQWRKVKEGETQDLVPSEYYSIPSVPENSTILVFAGSTGEVARKLKAKRFIFTDLMKARLMAAKERSDPEFLEKTNFVLTNVFFVPLKDDCADYSFSFEPIPVIFIPYFLLELIRCSKKGIIITEPKERVGYGSIGKKLGRHLAKHTVDIKETVIPVTLSPNKYGGREEKIVATIIEITKETKKKTTIDLEIIKGANKIAGKSNKLTREDLEKVREIMGMDESDFKEALDRIRTVCEYPHEPDFFYFALDY